jgi:hypothetical protein
VGKVTEPGDRRNGHADRLRGGVGGQIPEGLDEVADQEIGTAALVRADMREDQPLEIIHGIPPGGRRITGAVFAPGIGEGDRRSVKISTDGSGR